MFNQNKRKKKSSSARRIASQQEESLKKISGDKYLNLYPAIHFCEQKSKETGTTTFKALINKNGDHNDKTKQADKIIGQGLDSLGNNGEQYIRCTLD